MYLLDTKIISSVRVRKEKVIPAWHWAEKVELDKMFISVLSLYEIKKGIQRVRRKDSNFAEDLTQWLEKVIIPGFNRNNLVVSSEVSIISGIWAGELSKDSVDILIAGTALHHEMTLVTRNTKDFSHIKGLKLLNPWDIQ